MNAPKPGPPKCQPLVSLVHVVDDVAGRQHQRQVLHDEVDRPVLARPRRSPTRRRSRPRRTGRAATAKSTSSPAGAGRRSGPDRRSAANAGDRETIFCAVAYSGSPASGRLTASRSAAKTQRPPTDSSTVANCRGRSAYVIHGRDGSGSSAGGTGWRRGWRAGCHPCCAMTLPVQLAETLGRHRRQLALPAPGVEAVVDQEARQLRHERAGQPAGEAVQRDRMRNTKLTQPSWRSASTTAAGLVRQLASPGEQLVVHVDLHRADVGA